MANQQKLSVDEVDFHIPLTIYLMFFSLFIHSVF